MTALFESIFELFVGYLSSLITPFFSWIIGLLIIHSIIKLLWSYLRI